MTAEPVQVLVTIHPPEHGHADWMEIVRRGVSSQMLTLYGGQGSFELALVHGWPHGEAKAHREAAVGELRKAGYDEQFNNALAAQTHSLAAIAHALLALGERP